jgi:hypothetical protein
MKGMGSLPRSRPGYYVWSLLISPLVGTLVAVLGTRGEGGVPKFVFLFVGLPALLAIGAALAMRRGAVDTIAGAVGAAVTGGLNWFLILLWLEAQGVFDT